MARLHLVTNNANPFKAAARARLRGLGDNEGGDDTGSPAGEQSAATEVYEQFQEENAGLNPTQAHYESLVKTVNGVRYIPLNGVPSDPGWDWNYVVAEAVRKYSIQLGGAWYWPEAVAQQIARQAYKGSSDGLLAQIAFNGPIILAIIFTAGIASGAAGSAVGAAEAAGTAEAISEATILSAEAVEAASAAVEVAEAAGAASELAEASAILDTSLELQSAAEALAQSGEALELATDIEIFTGVEAGAGDSLEVIEALKNAPDLELLTEAAPTLAPEAGSGLQMPTMNQIASGIKAALPALKTLFTSGGAAPAPGARLNPMLQPGANLQGTGNFVILWLLAIVAGSGVIIAIQRGKRLRRR